MKYIIRLSYLMYITLFSVSGTLLANDPTFHLKNNSAGEIQYELLQQSKSVTGGLKMLLKGYSGKFNLDINKPTTIHLYYCLTPAACKIALPEKGKVHKAKVTFPAGKTIYIKFDGKKIGVQKGVKGRTSEGYDAGNNVTDNDIIQVNSQTSDENII